MKKIVILSTDTLHHRYFINYLLDQLKFSLLLIEVSNPIPKFKTGPLFEVEEHDFELQNFFKEIPNSLPSKLIKSVKSVNNEMSLNLLKEIEPDFGIVFGTGRISEEVINLFKDGLINVHRGMSEKYRGLDSDLWAIYHNDYSSIGVTVHKVFAELDAGDILYCEAMPLISSMKIYQIRYYTTLIASKLVLDSIFNYLKGNIKLKPQKKIGRYYSYMPFDLKKITQKNFNDYCKTL